METNNEKLVKMVENGEITVLEAIEDGQRNAMRYADTLEKIIEAINLSPMTRKLVDVLIKEAKNGQAN